MKTSLKILILTVFGLAMGCIENPELEPPSMTLSYTDTENIKFSWREPAVITVKLQSDEDIERFTLTSLPSYWQKDTTFPPYTHYAEFDLSFSLGRGYKVSDSSVALTFKAYSNGLCNEQYRKLRYKFEYPQIDSFDIEMSCDPVKGKCLLNIEEQAAFKYTEYRNRYFDLVFVKEDRIMWRSFGLALASPDAELYLNNYFNYKIPEYEYQSDLTPSGLRTTYTGTISNDAYLTWNDLTPQLVDTEERFLYRYLGDDENYGLGISNLQLQTFYKIKLHNGKKAILRITNIDISDSYPKIQMTVYYQK